uniref:Uncharacterized protein n=1 Tax=Tanacetum cinerariifolium TaxID=118510 RepID=A0A699IN08_TANCI|nr:hypothetical protein [Tanacetum cinerariifolium]
MYHIHGMTRLRYLMRKTEEESPTRSVWSMLMYLIILDICPRLEGVNFTDVLDDDTTLAFLIKLGYKGALYKHTIMFVDHMCQPWRTLIRPKKSRGKGSQGKKIVDDFQETVDVSEESEPEPKAVKRKTSSMRRVKKKVTLSTNDDTFADVDHAGCQDTRKSTSGSMQLLGDRLETVDVSEESEPKPKAVKRKTSSMRRVKKKVTLSADDDSIFDDPDTTLELGKSISQTKAEEEEAARQVHATHARIATDIMQALKESKRTSKRQPCTRGSNEGTGTIPGVLDESTVISATSGEGTGTKPGVLYEEKEITEENVILDYGLE